MQLIESGTDFAKSEGVFDAEILYSRISRKHGLSMFWYCLRSKDNLDEIINKVRSPLTITPFSIQKKSTCEFMILYNNSDDGIPIIESYLYQACAKRNLESLKPVFELKKSYEACDDFEKKIWLNIAAPIAHAVQRCPVDLMINHENSAFKNPEEILELAPPETIYDTYRAFMDHELILTDDIMKQK